MKSKFFILFLFLCILQPVISQEIHDEEYFKRSIEKADSLLNIGHIDEVIRLSREVISHSDKFDNDSILAEAMNNLGSIYRVYGKNDSTSLYSSAILKLDKNIINPNALVDSYTHLGGEKRLIMEHDSALYYFLKGRKVIEEKLKQDSAAITANLLEISSCYLMLYQEDSAITNCIKAVNYINENNLTTASYSYARISDIFRLALNYDRAKEYGDKSFELSEKTSFKELKINSRITLANLNFHQENYEETVRLLSEAKELIGKKKSRYQAKIGVPLLKGKLYLNNKLTQEELQQLDELKKSTQDKHDIARLDLILLKAKSLSINRKEFEKKWADLWVKLNADNKIYYQKVLLKIKYSFYRKNNEWESALVVKEKIEEVFEKFNHTRQNYAVHELETIYKKKEQDNKIIILDKQNEIQAIKINNKNKLLLAGGIGLGLISLLALFLFNSRKTIDVQKNEIAKSLDEKDTLLREIHHRVKNNLQVISSLLRLQSNTAEDEVAIEALKEGQSRVQSMSLIHQDLYQKENLTGLNVSSYLEKLSSNLFNTYDISKDRISLITEIQDLNLDVDSVVPLGLIINELVTNALKYAFPDNRKGAIKITLEEIDDNLHLTVQDNGVGISSMDEMNTTNSFGHRLINSFARKLDATTHISGENGTEVKMIIKEYTSTN